MSHAPKQAALEAFASGLLSPAGRARVERHLARCAPCNELLLQVRAYQSLRADAAAEALPELSWDRLSQALDKPLPQPEKPTSSTGRLIALAWPLLAVAATILIAWIGMSGGPETTPQVSVKPRPSVVPAPGEVALRGQVTLVAGAVFQERGGERIPVTLGSELDEHSVLVSEPGATLHVVLRDQTGFVMGSDSRLHLAELREHGIHLELTLGSVTSHVKKLEDAQRYSVATADYSAHVRGTRFVVEKRDGMRVFVHEGEVEVTHKGTIVATLLAGQAFESPRSGANARPNAHAEKPADPPLHTPSLGAAALQLPAVPSVRAWVIDGVAVAAHGGLAMRLPPGAVTLRFEDARGQLRTVDLLVDAAGTTLDEVALGKLTTPTEREGHLEPAQIGGAVRAGLDQLRRCYERSLRSSPNLGGKLTLSMRVAADGHVQRAEVKGSDLPVELQRCLTQEAQRLRFPRPEGGGGLSFDVPLNLRSGR